MQPATVKLSLDLMYYPRATDELRDKLWPLKLSYGDFQNVLKEPAIYNTLQVIAAVGPRGGIHAWAGVYVKNGETFVGIFVDTPYRKQGLGTRLKSEALRLCKEQGINCVWQDRHAADCWVKVDALTGNEERFPYNRYE